MKYIQGRSCGQVTPMRKLAKRWSLSPFLRCVFSKFQLLFKMSLFLKLNQCCHSWFSDLGGKDKEDYALAGSDMSYAPFHDLNPFYFPNTLHSCHAEILPRLATFFSSLSRRLFPLLTLPGCLKFSFVQSALLYEWNHKAEG